MWELKSAFEKGLDYRADLPELFIKRPFFLVHILFESGVKDDTDLGRLQLVLDPR